MPIKIQCQQCQAVMAVRDEAAGRAVKCKKCGARVPVPAPGQRAPAKARKKKKKRRPPAQPAFADPDHPDDLFGGMDLRRAEHRDEKLCPNCATVVDEEDFECPECGVNVETGALSEIQRKKRARGGPDPDQFFGVIWSNSWKFVKRHMNFVFKTGITWGLSITMVIIAGYVIRWYTFYRAIELKESASSEVQFLDEGVLIEFAADAGKTSKITYDGVQYQRDSTQLTNGRLLLPTPQVAAWLSPPTYFWCFIFLVFTLACCGWAWTLCDKVVEVTMQKEKEIKRFQGDVFANMTKGFTTVFWPIVLMYPFMWIPFGMYFLGVSVQICVITFLVLFLTPYLLFLPIAVIHMSQNYAYRAWLFSWVAKDFFNTIGPNLFVSGLFFVTVTALPLGLGIGTYLLWDQVAEFYQQSVELQLLSATVGYSADDANSTFSLMFYRVPLLFGLSFLCGTILFSLLAIPAVFMMRVMGLFGLYFRPDMDLCYEQKALAPAGFGPRFLAIQVDMIIATLMCAASVKGAGALSGLIEQLYSSEQVANIAYWAGLAISIFVALGFYFANWESGSGRATLGKWTFKLIVLREDNDPMSFKQAMQRFAYALLSVISLSGTFTMCAFHPKHRALHDLASKSKVVWRGEGVG